MGKFDGILIASDWDGTLCYDNTVSEKNVEAINYFMENGGKFTICSGRHYSYLQNFSHLVKPNTYTVSINGALIYDQNTDDCLYSGVCDDKIIPIIEKIIDFALYDKLYFHLKDSISPYIYTKENLKKAIEDLKELQIRKAVFITDNAKKSILGRDMANSLSLGDYTAVRSWETSLEIIHKDNSKGKALQRLKAALSAEAVIAVGDFENDIAMFRAADRSYAVENACEELKRIATHKTSSVYDASLQDVIASL